MELMRFPLENTHSSRAVREREREARSERGVGGWRRRDEGFGWVVVVLKLSFFFAGNVSRGQEWYESRGLVSGRDGPRDSIGQM